MQENNKKTGAELIALERNRQMEGNCLGWEQDSECSVGALATLGIAYAYSGIGNRVEAIRTCSLSLPFFKPEDAERDLVRAGAMMAAAIDRIHLASSQMQESTGTKGSL